MEDRGNKEKDKGRNIGTSCRFCTKPCCIYVARGQNDSSSRDQSSQSLLYFHRGSYSLDLSTLAYMLIVYEVPALA